MIRRAALFAFALAASANTSAAQECLASFKPEATTGAITAMTLFNFGEHWELQFETPRQGALSDLELAIDGATQQVFLSGGLDDLLFVVSTEEASLQLSEEFRTVFAKGGELNVGVKSDGRPETARFKLAGSGAAVKRLAAGCK